MNYEETVKKTEEDIFKFMSKHPQVYGDIKTIEGFIKYHMEKDEKEKDEAYAQGWEGPE